jgi:dihydrofolate synthase/folylpolyglutamate synthase
VFVDDEVTIKENRVTPQGQRVRLESSRFRRPLSLTLGMHGECQGRNAALAALAVKVLFPEIDEGLIEAGLADAVLPARFQVLHPAAYPGISALVLDGAHTVDSVTQGVATFLRLFGGGGVKPALLFACGKSKNAADIAPLFAGFSPIFLTRPGEFPSLDEASLRGAFTAANLPATYDDDYRHAIRSALAYAQKNNAPLFTTGSFYLAGAALQEVSADYKDGVDG